MTTDRCTACGAALSAGAPWCTLCYADLRTNLAPAQAPVPAAEQPLAHAMSGGPAVGDAVGQRVPAPAPALDPLTAPLRAILPMVEPMAVAPAIEVATAPAVTPVPAPPRPPEHPTWPCLECGARMAMSEDACNQCGRAFLPAAAGPALSLPGLGKVGQIDKTQQFMLIAGGLFAVMVLLVGLAWAAGSIL